VSEHADLILIDVPPVLWSESTSELGKHADGTILVLSGVTGDPNDVPADLEPDLVLASIADLPGSLL
jgi:hypothetical protein